MLIVINVLQPKNPSILRRSAVEAYRSRIGNVLPPAEQPAEVWPASRRHTSSNRPPSPIEIEIEIERERADVEESEGFRADGKQEPRKGLIKEKEDKEETLPEPRGYKKNSLSVY